MEIDYDIMLNKVIVFVAEHTGLNELQLNENTKIEDDVGLAGLDSIEFYEDFFTEFQIVNPQDFDSKKFVSPENIDLIDCLRILFSKNVKQEFKVSNEAV
jgi:hypothetical protein